MQMSEVDNCPIQAFINDELLRLELRIAQRADELSRDNGSNRLKDVAHWIQAEHELWAAFN
jgi:hypothetical protein